MTPEGVELNVSGVPSVWYCSLLAQHMPLGIPSWHNMCPREQYQTLGTPNTFSSTPSVVSTGQTYIYWRIRGNLGSYGINVNIFLNQFEISRQRLSCPFIQYTP